MIVLLVLVTALAIARYALLFLSATEGDTPPASVVALPSGSEVVGDDVECGSGGCWRLLTVRPPTEMTAEFLANELEHRMSGTVCDPRTVDLSSEVDVGFLVVRAAYWS
ncbi:hypothetical protein BIU90_11385 [Curtobacterium sp. MCBA15_001]|nr:hypothetical protein BIU90_11385 [Curtobacterium sp. MCBA15_001]